MINLAWGGYTNGEIPTSVLIDVSGRGDYLERTAARQFLAMRAAIKTDVGFDLQPASGSSANRTEATQITFFTQRYTKVSRNTGLWWNGSYWTKNAGAAVAAVPGTSNHGWARAIDLNISRYDTKAWAWMQAHAREYGYDWATGKASGEDWHWECLTAPGTTTAGGNATLIVKEDDDEMATSIVMQEPNGTLWLLPEDGSMTALDSMDELAALIMTDAIKMVRPTAKGNDRYWIPASQNTINLRRQIATRKHALN